MGALYIDHLPAGNSGAVDHFISPIVANNPGIDSMFVSWPIPIKPEPVIPGPRYFLLTPLNLLVTTDCGFSFQSVWKKWGTALQTVNDPNPTNTPSFVPNGSAEWITSRVYLTPYVGSGSFQLYFSAKSNHQNNLWLDDIQVNSKTLPQRLKDQGYLIYPNPFANTVLLHHAVPPADLQTVEVYNSAGQLVWTKKFNRNAPTEIAIDLKNKSVGVYILKLMYASKTIIDRIVKNG